MKTPFPFEPLWKVRCGFFTTSSQGMLPGKLKPLVDEFVVLLPDTAFRVLPKEGYVYNGNTPILKGKPGLLRWFRRMEMQLATKDTNDAGQASPVFYGLGIEGNDEYLQIFQDGKVKICPHFS